MERSDRRDEDRRGVTVRFLGSGDAFGSGGRFQTCLLVDCDDLRVLVDCGATSLVAMRRHGIDPASIDAVVLSHLHGDHFGGLPFLFLDFRYVSRRRRPLVVAGPPGHEARILRAMEILFPGSSAGESPFGLDFVALPEGKRTPLLPREGPRKAPVALSVETFSVLHPSGAPSYALRLECGGRVIGYSGDTEWTDALVDVAAGADLFVCECYGYDRAIPNHLDFATLSDHLERFDCRRLVLTHMSEAMIERARELDVETAEDGMTIEVDGMPRRAEDGA